MAGKKGESSRQLGAIVDIFSIASAPLSLDGIISLFSLFSRCLLLRYAFLATAIEHQKTSVISIILQLPAVRHWQFKMSSFR